jgi:replicative DNA helicase
MPTEVIEQLQLAALYHATRGHSDIVFSICDVADFLPGHQMDLAAICVSLMHDGQVTPLAVLDRCSKQSRDLVTFYTTRVSAEEYGTPTFCANAVRDYGNRERLKATVTRAQQALTSQKPVEQIVSDLTEAIGEHEAALSSGLAVVDFEEVMGTLDDIRPWIMPTMLRTNERMIITGAEGFGKSVLVAQMCLGAAMGVNTLDFALGTHDPVRVLMLDVENDRLQVRNNVRKVYPYLYEMSGGVKPVIEWVDSRDVDLSDSVERQRVIRLAKERQPQLMYMGSLYRLAPEQDRADAQFTHVSRTVDRIRAETGASVLLEAHTGHGMQNDRNGAMRPYGSSMWMRWPEFGLGMVRHSSGAVELKNWRGHRSDDRLWPAGLRRGTVLPWTPITAEQWAAEYDR